MTRSTNWPKLFLKAQPDKESETIPMPEAGEEELGSRNGCCRDQSLAETERDIELAGGPHSWVEEL